jgi:hypothetical protein
MIQKFNSALQPEAISRTYNDKLSGDILQHWLSQAHGYLAGRVPPAAKSLARAFAHASNPLSSLLKSRLACVVI